MTDTSRAVVRVADRQAGKVAAAFAGSLHLLRDQVARDRMRIALERGDVGMAVNAFPWEIWAREFERLVVPRILETMRQSGEVVGRQTRIEKVEFSLRGVFDIKNPRAFRIASEIAAQLVTRVTDATRWAIRHVIADAQLRGIDVRAQAQEISEILVNTAGLDGPRARRLARFEEGLAERQLSPSRMAERVEAYRDRLVMDRTRTIARHETQTAAVAGQDELWQQAVDAGLIDADMQREWITAEDERTCPICQPMDGQVVRRGELFVGGNGMTYAKPPIHVQCRCTLALVVPDA